jgi:hypothetical protein
MKKLILTLTLLLFLSLMIGTGGVASAQEGFYTHPTGAFSLVEFGQLADEVEDGALFVDEGAMLMVLFGQAPIELTEETLPSVVLPILDGVTEFETYELYSDDIVSLENGFVISFAPEPADEYGVGDVFVTQYEDYIYVMILLAWDYEAVLPQWQEAVASFTIGDYIPPEELEEEEAVPEEEEAAPEEEEAVEEEPADDTAAPANTILSGFTPEVDGFSFYNYGNDIPASNLTPDEVRRMFGDEVCASLVAEECILTPPAQQWMEQINEYMSGGHCEGMAVLSSLMYYDQVDPAEFGGSTPSDLVIENNDPLQREIAYWWTTQATFPGASLRINESPNAVLDALIENFQEGKNASEWWAMGFYRRDGSAGHAVTPIGVEDQGNGIYHVLLYDNNFPGETRVLEIDRNTNTWWYEGSPNPEIESFLYDGDAELQNLELVAISPRLEPQACDFCAAGAMDPFSEGGDALNAKRAAPAAQESEIPVWSSVQARWALLIYGQTDEFYQIWLVGQPELLVVDDWGRRIGYAGGEFVNEIPGAATQNMRIFQTSEGLDKDKSPVYRIPVGLSFEVVVDAGLLEEPTLSDVSMIGPGYYLDVAGVYLEPGETESIGVYIDKSRHQLTYNTLYSESPDIELGLVTEEADYAMIVRATELIALEDTFDVIVDMETHEFILNTSYNTEPSTYELYVLRIDENGEHVFGASDIVMEPENTAYIPFTEWDGDEASGLSIDFDYENDGEIDESFELPNVTGEIEFYEEE